MTVTARGWAQQLRAGLPSEQATTIVLTVGFLLVSAIAALAIGDRALMYVLAACCAWLLWDRAQLLDRCDQASDDADRALAALLEAPVRHATPDEDTDEYPVITQPQAAVLLEHWADGLPERPSPGPRVPTVQREIGGRVFQFRAEAEA